MNDAGDNSMGNNNSISGVSGSGGDDVPLPQDSSSSSGRNTKRHKHLQGVFDSGSGNMEGDTNSSWLVNADVAAAAADALDDRKPAALPSNSDSSTLDDNNDEVRNSQKRKIGDADDNNDDDGGVALPLAPSLQVFLTPGGHIKYAPRPEWFQFTKDPSEEVAVTAVAVAAASGEEGTNHPISMATMQSQPTVPLIPNRDENDDRGGAADQPPPVDGVIADAENNNINQFAIHEDDATAQVRGGNNPLRAPPVVGGRRNRFRGSHRSVLERIGRAQEWHEQEWNMRQIDRQYDLSRSQHNDVALAPPPGLDFDAFMPLVLRRDQLYYMSRGVPLERAEQFAHPAAAPRLIVNNERMHDREEGEENEEGGMIDVERVAHEPEVLADDGDVVPTIVLHPHSQSFIEKVAVFGYDCDTALHKAIKLHATEAALGLIREGACVDIPNAKVRYVHVAVFLYYLAT